jgi:hypothetical protein
MVEDRAVDAAPASGEAGGAGDAAAQAPGSTAAVSSVADSCAPSKLHARVLNAVGHAFIHQIHAKQVKRDPKKNVGKEKAK